MWEQVKNVADYQKWWSDNAVSATITFTTEEASSLSSVLEAYEDSLKAISFLPLETNGYAQLPYEAIDKDVYDEMVSKITKPDFSFVTTSPAGAKYCDNDHCEI